MKKHNFLVILIAILIAGACLSVCVAGDNSPVRGLNSTSDFFEAQNLAKAQNKSIVLIFDQDSCVYCDILKENALSDSKLQDELNSNYITAIVDVNKNYDLAAKYNIYGTPAVVFVDCDGGELGRISGYVEADEFLNELERI